MSKSIRYETEQRYYLVRCQRDLFGELVLSRYWGGKGNLRGGEMHQVMTGYQATRQALDDIERTRKKHGYRKTSD